jgi:hypothetical protein
MLWAGTAFLLMFCGYALLERLKGQVILKWIMNAVFLLGALSLLSALTVLILKFWQHWSPEEELVRPGWIPWGISYGTLSIAGLAGVYFWPRLWPYVARIILGPRFTPHQNE